MKNIKRTIGMAKYFVLVAFISTTAFLTSCTDNTTNPLESSYESTSVLTGGELGDKNGGGTDDRKGGGTDDKKGGGKDDKKKGIPVDCFGLDREQLVKFKELQSQRELANKPILDRFNAQMKEIKMAEKAAMGDLLTKERELKKQLAELRKGTENSPERIAFNELQRDAKARIEAIRKAEKEARNAIMKQVKAGEITRDEAKVQLEELRASNKVLVDAIMAEIKAAKQALIDSMNANASEEEIALQNQLKEIKTQLDAIRENTKAQLDALNAEIKAATAANDEAFFNAFRDMLNDEQKAKFDAWRTSGTNPCDPTTKP